jgi:hypothetical protein
VFAPPAVNVDDEPEHIVDGDAEAVTAGVGLTVTVIEAVLLHPLANVPVTVYVVVLVGVTVLELPVPKLCDQLYVFAPLAVSTVLCPEHIGFRLAFTDNTGAFLVNAMGVELAKLTLLALP